MATREELIALLRAAADMLEAELASGSVPSPVVIPGVRQLVTLDQCAAMVRKRKRSLYNHAGMPTPVRRAVRRGGTDLYDWDQMRPWLEREFGVVDLPPKHPAY